MEAQKRPLNEHESETGNVLIPITIVQENNPCLFAFSLIFRHFLLFETNLGKKDIEWKTEKE